MVGKDHDVASFHMRLNDNTTGGSLYSSHGTLKKRYALGLQSEFDCREQWPLYASYADNISIHKTVVGFHA